MASTRNKRNEKKVISFKARFNMTKSEWAKKKRELRAEGNGIEIDKIYKAARAQLG